ncbi:MAG: hydrogenase expression/formation protein HypE [Nitrospiraceae bacterium]|nr:hydrogenase expression/formation protein HypE [Nitrospiraceae bacterium]
MINKESGKEEEKEKILLGHGSGGRLMRNLVSGIITSEFKMEEPLMDSAILDLNGSWPNARLAFTTDSYVVSPFFFEGGDIGDLAINGTVNDLAVSGAQPLAVSAGFIIEEGFAVGDLKKIIISMSRAAQKAGVRIVTGDTKVVEKGKGDGIFINTSGIGLLDEKTENLSPRNIRPGDIVIVSGDMGRHGISVMARRNGIDFDPPLASDTKPLNGLVKRMLSNTGAVRVMRDPTRGGLATVLKEFAVDSGFSIVIKEKDVPVMPSVKGACGLLGLDHLYAACEGALVAVVAPELAEDVLDTMRHDEAGLDSAIIGEVVSPGDYRQGSLILETLAGGERMLDMLSGEQLPRIC